MASTIHSYRDLTVWQKAKELAVAVYELTDNFPSSERFGLCSQMRRAAVSIASNIAEGRHRGTRKDFLQFLHIAYGSSTELETQILIAKELARTKFLKYQRIDALLQEILKMLNVMIQKLKASS